MQSDLCREKLKPLINKHDITRRLRISRRTLERWLSDGVLPAADVRPTKLTRLWTPENLNKRFPGVF
jgi:hypothetical protein